MKKRAAIKPVDPTLGKDLKTLARFIHIYCDERHAAAPKKTRSKLKGFEFAELGIPAKPMCASCAKLLAHAFVKRAHCPFSPRPACRHCESHCYQPRYREQIRKVMRYSGKRLILTGHLDVLFELLF